MEVHSQFRRMSELCSENSRRLLFGPFIPGPSDEVQELTGVRHWLLVAGKGRLEGRGGLALRRVM